MLLLGIDLGTSSVKVSVVDAKTQHCVATIQYPESEAEIISVKPGWAEQSPEIWWQYTICAILKLNSTKKYPPKNISAIGIAYQMHGLVLVDKQQKILRHSIIWCDNRSVKIGEEAFNNIGQETCSTILLNSPGNFTASKLAWVKINEPKIYNQIDKMLLPGDFISMKLTGEISTTSSALSECIMWDFKKDELSKDVTNYFGFDKNIIPELKPVFSSHGNLLSTVAKQLELKANIPVTYKAGDQLNNALSLNALSPGDVVASAGTSGVIYAVSDKLVTDKFSRINSFAHVNHKYDKKRIGVLLCINGAGIMNSWIKKLSAAGKTYNQINTLASKVKPGCDGLMVLPFGNGAERMLYNKNIGAHIYNINLNIHTNAHIYRATQEGIAFSFRYGLEIMKENKIKIDTIRAYKANLFKSDVFIESFVNATGIPLELFATDGSAGAAIGAGIGDGIYTLNSAFANIKFIDKLKPKKIHLYNSLYNSWKDALENYI